MIHHLHRVTQVEDEACAEEGGVFYYPSDSIPPGHWRENQGDPIPKSNIKSVEDEFPALWVAYIVIFLATVGVSSWMAA